MSFSKQVILTHSKSQPSNGEELPNGRRSASSNSHCSPQYLPSTTYSFLDRKDLGFYAHHRFSENKKPFSEIRERARLKAAHARRVRMAHAHGCHGSKGGRRAMLQLLKRVDSRLRITERTAHTASQTSIMCLYIPLPSLQNIPHSPKHCC